MSKTCTSCFKHFTGSGWQCTHCLLHSEIQDNRRAANQAQKAAQEFQKEALRQDRINEMNRQEENRRFEAELARQHRDQMRAQELSDRRIAEANVSTEDAYDYGKNYTKVSMDENPQDLKLMMTLQGELYFKFDNPYLLPHLNAAFLKGLKKSGEKVDLGTDFEYIVSRYLKSGKEGTAPYQIRSVNTVHGHHAMTEPDDQLVIHPISIDMNDGTLRWHLEGDMWHPKLREAFDRGLSERSLEFNTPEKRALRLKNEKARLAAEANAIKKAEIEEAEAKERELVLNLINCFVLAMSTLAFLWFATPFAYMHPVWFILGCIVTELVLISLVEAEFFERKSSRTSFVLFPVVALATLYMAWFG